MRGRLHLALVDAWNLGIPDEDDRQPLTLSSVLVDSNMSPLGIRRAPLAICPLLLAAFSGANSIARGESTWKKHVVHEGIHNTTAVAADYTGDGKVDVIINAGGKTRLFVAPDWKEVVIDETPGQGAIHSETFDIDGDGDPDYIGARHEPGLIFWLENPGKEKADAAPWKSRLVDDQVNGVHGVLVGDVDGDGKLDLIGNSGLPTGPFANSVAWFRVPKDPLTAERWDRFIPADGDAPGHSHYLGLGDVTGDGRKEIFTAAKGGPQASPGTGEWFAFWEQPKDATARGWKKTVVATGQPGATNLHPGDINGDGKVDILASRGHGTGLVWYESPGWKPHEIDTELLSPHCLAVVDFDLDGDLDAATCGYDSKIAAWFENDGKGTFTRHILDRNQCAYDIRAVDMDRDGDLDILIAGQLSKNVVWYENPVK